MKFKLRLKKISKKQRGEDLRVMNKITSKVRISQKEINKIAEKIKRGIAKRHGLSLR